MVMEQPLMSPLLMAEKSLMSELEQDVMPLHYRSRTRT